MRVSLNEEHTDVRVRINEPRKIFRGGGVRIVKVQRGAKLSQHLWFVGFDIEHFSLRVGSMGAYK